MEINTWRAMRNAFREALSSRGPAVDENNLRLMTRVAPEDMESRGYRLVPIKPTAEMQAAVRHALDEGKRQSVKWVGPLVKNRWRYLAAIKAAPQWRAVTIMPTNFLHLMEDMDPGTWLVTAAKSRCAVMLVKGA